jgi:flagellar basal body rod protein FlgB
LHGACQGDGRKAPQLGGTICRSGRKNAACIPLPPWHESCVAGRGRPFGQCRRAGQPPRQHSNQVTGHAMSLFGAMTTAIGGLNAQSRALANVSNNLANSQTVGYKRVDTSFIDLVTQSSRTSNSSDSVRAKPDYTNSVQGTVEQSDSPSALAISGGGFFSVAALQGETDGAAVFDQRQFVTRAGDFQINTKGYLVNSAG